jgi:TorA maturation chaperone TorD
MSDADAIHVLLAGRAGVYRLFQNILGNEPSTEMLEELGGESALKVFQLFADGQAEFGQAVDALITQARECRVGGEEALDKLDSSFTRLFVGPNVPEASPWESFYLGGDGTLFQRITLEVRNAYRVQGLLPAGYPSVADDHIAIELDYLAQLAQRAEASWAAGDSTATLNSLTASKDFLQEHLTKWASHFATEVATSRYAVFYREAAASMAAFLPIDQEALGELMGILKNCRD